MKHRNCTFVALGLAGAMLLSGCSGLPGGKQEPAETVVLYEALPLPDIRMEIPDGFEETSSEFYEKYYIKDDASIIITEDKNGPFNSAYDYSIRALNEYNGVATTVEVNHDEFLQAVNCGVQLLEFRYTLGDNAEADMTCLAGFATDGDSMFIVTCKSKTETFGQYKDGFYAVMKTLMMTGTK